MSNNKKEQLLKSITNQNQSQQARSYTSSALASYTNIKANETHELPSIRNTSNTPGIGIKADKNLRASSVNAIQQQTSQTRPVLEKQKEIEQLFNKLVVRPHDNIISSDYMDKYNTKQMRLRNKLVNLSHLSSTNEYGSTTRKPQLKSACELEQLNNTQNHTTMNKSHHNTITAKSQIQSIWDIVTLHQVMQHQQEIKEAQIKKKQNKDMLKSSYDEQQKFIDHQRQMQIDEIDQDNQQLIRNIKDHKKFLRSKKQQKKQQMRMLYDHYTNHVNTRDNKIIQEYVINKKDDQIKVAQISNEYQVEKQEKKLLRRYLQEDVSNFNRTQHDKTLQNIQLKKQIDKDQDESQLRHHFKPFDTAQERYRNQIQRSLEKQEVIKQYTITSPLKIHSLAEKDRKDNLDQIINKNYEKGIAEFNKREDQKLLVMKKNLSEMRSEQYNQIRIKNLLLREEYDFSKMQEEQLLKVDKKIFKQQKLQDKLMRSSQKEKVKDELLKQMQEQERTFGVEDIDSKEFALNKNLIKTFKFGIQ
ncbi:UNKNOWN [Stylonychia lemnae]|uniref:Uncharacterized protein n=1 Tax=Stylonychia lemnae TaxID=5949 RepID=A0A078AVI4_STYLE|nr:UNKNOWN [Stylonychia lemnae]|eukprot:CDW86076.1 UNKNOWN [Stylonychia lemnae]